MMGAFRLPKPIYSWGIQRETISHFTCGILLESTLYSDKLFEGLLSLQAPFGVDIVIVYPDLFSNTDHRTNDEI